MGVEHTHMHTSPSTWPIGLTTIAIASEHAGLQPYWKRVETELYLLADRYKEDPRELRVRLVLLQDRIADL
jgi:hypothetical protein